MLKPIDNGKRGGRFDGVSPKRFISAVETAAKLGASREDQVTWLNSPSMFQDIMKVDDWMAENLESSVYMQTKI